MTPRSNRVLSAVAAILVLAPAVLAIQQDGAPASKEITPAQKVKDFAAAVRDVMRLGGAATSALATQGKTESTATQTLLNSIGQAIKEKAASAGVDTAPSAIEAPIKRLVSAARDVLALKDKAIEPLAAAIGDKENEDVKVFVVKAEGRVYAGLCVAAIRPYLGPDGRASGTFDGMFAKLDKYDKEKIADAFLDIFQSSSTSGVRELAGEGLAQVGSARHQAGVKAILGNANESGQIRQRAVYTLARLGDRGPVDKIFATLNAKIDELKKPDMSAQDARQVADLYRQGATYAQMIHDTDAAVKYYENSVKTVEAMKEKPSPETFQNTYYNLACLYSLKGDLDGGLKYLEKAFAVGYENYKWANTDGDLANLRKDPRFKALIDKWESGKGKAESAPASKPS